MTMTNTTQKLRREANSLLGLSIINMVANAMVLAFAVSTLFPNLLAMVNAQSILLPELAWTILGLLAFVISLRWLSATAEVLELHKQLKEGTEKTQDEEVVTSVIVDAMATYREKRGTIKLMLLISRIAGVGFAIAGTYTVVNAVFAGGASLWLLAGAIPNFAIAAAAFIIPHYFSKYSNVWDRRLRETEKAEKLLAQQLGTA
jgi:hypothetical protein